MVNLSSKNWELKNIKAVLFDKDGTFLDDNIYWGKLAELRIHKIIKYFNLNKNLFSDLCHAIGHDCENCKLIKNGPVGVMSRNEVVNFVVNELKKYNVSTSFEVISEIFDNVHKEFLENMINYVKFIKNSEQFIRNLKNKGIKLAVVTSDNCNNTKEILKILKINEMFDCVIGRDSCNEEKKSGKPALLALNELNVKAEDTIVIGDALMDFLMAKNANLKGVILVATGQTEFSDLLKINKNTVKNLCEVCIK